MGSIGGTQRLSLVWAMLVAAVLGAANIGICSGQDLVLDGVNEAALDLPRILFLLKRTPAGPALMPAGGFEANYGFLDTGASGIVLSRQTAELMGVKRRTIYHWLSGRTIPTTAVKLVEAYHNLHMEYGEV